MHQMFIDLIKQSKSNYIISIYIFVLSYVLCYPLILFSAIFFNICRAINCKSFKLTIPNLTWNHHIALTVYFTKWKIYCDLLTKCCIWTCISKSFCLNHLKIKFKAFLRLFNYTIILIDPIHAVITIKRIWRAISF